MACGTSPVGRPLIGRIAGEFWPITAEATSLPGVQRLYRGLTWLWGAADVASAAMTMTLLTWLPLKAFLPVKQLAGFALTAATVFLTVSLSLRHGPARGSGLGARRTGSGRPGR